MNGKRIHLVIIDPQNDFCDLPAEQCPEIAGTRQLPALPVSGADADLHRVAALIRAGGEGLSAITITLDSHQRVDIAHPTFWCDADGGPVLPFTPIRAQDVRAGRYQPRLTGARERVLAYLDALEAAERHAHMVWPVHCEIGTWGHNVHAAVRDAYNAWEEARVDVVDKVVKGSNPWTEHFSAIQAEVPDADDESTQLNVRLITQLRAADRVLVCGEAGSHCVKATTEHLVEQLPADERSKLILLTDCMSPVSGFAAVYHTFLEDMRRLGVRTATAADVLPLLLENR
ncbi:cysteine hydrolase [Accumulibacter sp.]|uniref:cysteine hydrolase family protein n=1 Tax=Accumulibacter sp. TaxID=2053492 RepID=UPI00260FFB3A|nr:cysteine hydrolase [Accumulibacter sp.]